MEEAAFCEWPGSLLDFLRGIENVCTLNLKLKVRQLELQVPVHVHVDLIRAHLMPTQQAFMPTLT